MLTCSNCGASVREGARFCTTCGTRLNDPVATDATSVWATPATGDTVASASQSTPDSIWTDAASDRVQTDPDDEPTSDAEAAPAVENEPTSDPDMGAGEQPTPVTSTDDAFNWSWGSSSAAEDAEANPAVDLVEVESGFVPDEREPSEAAPESDEILDATEIEIIEVDQTGPAAEADETTPDPDADTYPDPDTSDALLIVEDDDDDRQEESETLAAWAEQWETPDTDDAAPADEPEAALAPTAPMERDLAAVANPGEGGEEEDTVARAERLIGELRAIIPTLARPLAAAPAATTDTAAIAAIADDLAGAARSGQFDDLRDVLQAARANPRDVDTVLSLSGRVDRLLELLDDRDNLASKATDAAARLRPTSAETEQ